MARQTRDPGAGAAPPDLEVRALTPARFDDVVELFGTRGDPSWCWCQFFLTTGGDYTRSTDANREALKAQAARTPRPGLLAYAEGTPVGWVQVGPRPPTRGGAATAPCSRSAATTSTTPGSGR